MTDFLRINTPRAEKIVEILGLVTKSAASQRPTPTELDLWAQPVLHQLNAMGLLPPPGEEARGSGVEVVSPGPVKSVRGNFLDQARELTTRQQLDLIAVLATELEYKLWENETEKP